MRLVKQMLVSTAQTIALCCMNFNVATGAHHVGVEHAATRFHGQAQESDVWLSDESDMFSLQSWGTAVHEEAVGREHRQFARKNDRQTSKSIHILVKPYQLLQHLAQLARY